MSNLSSANRRSNAHRPHSPLTCGIVRDLDCPACRAAREQSDRAAFDRQTQIDRQYRTRQQAEELAEVLQAQRDELVPILLAMLVDGITDIVLAVVQEVRK